MQTVSTRRAAALAIGVLVVAGASACSVTEAESPAAPTPSTSSTPSASPTESSPASSATDAPAADVFETQNGSATFSVPAAWTIEDGSETGSNSPPGCGWVNSVTLTKGDVQLEYTDTDLGDASGGMPTWQVVDSEPIGDGVIAATWWTQYDSTAPIVAMAGLLPADAPLSGTDESGLGLPDRVVLDAGWMQFDTEPVEFATVEEAETYLASDGIAAAVDVLATWELTGTAGELPAGVSC